MKSETDEQQDFIDRVIAKRIEAGLAKSHIGVPALGRLVRIANHLQELGQKRYAKFGLTIMRHDILVNLLVQGEPYQLAPKALAEATFMTSGGISNALEWLEQAGYVERRPDPRDRRGVLVTLTLKGREFMAEVQPQVAATQHDVVKVLDTEELRILNDLLRKLLISVEQQVTA